MPVTIEPLGGLGNQLFVYALGLALAKRLGTTVEADLWRFHRYPWHVYELDTLPAQISQTYSSPLRGRVGHYARKVPRVLAHLGGRPGGLTGRLAIETRSVFDPRFLELSDGTRLSGYFQSWKYFEPVAAQVCSEVLSPLRPSDWLLETARELEKLGDWVAIHIRRGNYLQIPGMGVAGAGYYERALALIDQVHGELPVAVFSDDPAFAADMKLFQGERFRVITTPPEVRAIDALVAMSGAAAMIIGNSTFSWWAAFVRDSPGRSVVAPRPWLDNEGFSERDLFPSHWYTTGR
jgi:hypothetical protein